jgi:5'-nucleotidase
VEAAFFDVPAIAVSLYVPGGDRPWEELATAPEDFEPATDAARYLVTHAPDAGVFDQADYLNVNAPLDAVDEPEMRITEPSTMYDMTARPDGDDRLTLHDRIWERMRDDDLPDPDGTDRRAVVDGHVSVSPLLAPHPTRHHEALDGLAAAYRD